MLSRKNITKDESAVRNSTRPSDQSVFGMIKSRTEYSLNLYRRERERWKRKSKVKNVVYLGLFVGSLSPPSSFSVKDPSRGTGVSDTFRPKVNFIARLVMLYTHSFWDHCRDNWADILPSFRGSSWLLRVSRHRVYTIPARLCPRA